MYRWAENGTPCVPKSSPIRDGADAAKSEQRERERGASGAAVESVAKRTRRTFTAADKLRIVKRADACLASGKRGALGALLREEGVYSSLLGAWRTQLSARGSEGLEPRKPGRKPKLDAKDRQIAELTKRTARLERELHITNVLIALQKKAHEILGIALPTIDGED
jgi:transposase